MSQANRGSTEHFLFPTTTTMPSRLIEIKAHTVLRQGKLSPVLFGGGVRQVSYELLDANADDGDVRGGVVLVKYELATAASPPSATPPACFELEIAAAAVGASSIFLRTAGETEDAHTPCPVFAFNFNERWYFAPAGRAPGRPEVHYQYFTGPVFEQCLLVIDVG